MTPGNMRANDPYAYVLSGKRPNQNPLLLASSLSDLAGWARMG